MCILNISENVCVGVCLCVCGIMGGPRGQKEIGRVQTQRYSSAFITTILLEAREGVTERDKKIDRKTKQIISEHNKWQDNKVVGCVFPFCIRKG